MSLDKVPNMGFFILEETAERFGAASGTAPASVSPSASEHNDNYSSNLITN